MKLTSAEKKSIDQAYERFTKSRDTYGLHVACRSEEHQRAVIQYMDQHHPGAPLVISIPGQRSTLDERKHRIRSTRAQRERSHLAKRVGERSLVRTATIVAALTLACGTILAVILILEMAP